MAVLATPDASKWMDIKEFREGGYLQEVNRQFLHPLGLALAVAVDEGGNERLAGILDGRDDIEGFVYEDEILDKEKANKVLLEIWDRYGARDAALGFINQRPRQWNEEE